MNPACFGPSGDTDARQYWAVRPSYYEHRQAGSRHVANDDTGQFDVRQSRAIAARIKIQDSIGPRRNDGKRCHEIVLDRLREAKPGRASCGTGSMTWTGKASAIDS